MSDSTPLDGFIGKWRARWPEWGIAIVFVPAGRRAVVEAWFALLQEIADAAWGGEDPTPGLAKLAWWQEELRGWRKGARRHPLGDTLQGIDAPWDALASSLSGLPGTRVEAEGGDVAALRGLASAILACEAVLFEGSPPDEAGTTGATESLRALRALAQGDRIAAGRVSLSRGHNAAARPRRLHEALLGERLRLLAADAAAKRVPPLRVLWVSWRAARAGQG